MNQHRSHRRLPAIWVALAFSGILTVSGCKKDEPLPPPAASTATVSPGEATTPALPPGMNLGTFAAFTGGVDAPGGHCQLDSLNGSGSPTNEATVGQKLSGGGWMIDAGAQVPASATLVLATQAAKYGMQLLPGGARPDVAATLKNPAFETAGFNFEADTAGVAAGEYEIYIVFADGKSCSVNKKIVLK